MLRLLATIVGNVVADCLMKAVLTETKGPIACQLAIASNPLPHPS